MKVLAETMLTAPEVARTLRLPVQTVWSLARRGVIPRVAVGRLYRFPAAALEDWMARGGTGTSDGPPEAA